MINIAYTPEYQAYYKEWETVFAPKNFVSSELMLPNATDLEFRKLQLKRWANGMGEYRIERSYYKAENDGNKLWGAETKIFDETGATIYQYRIDDDDGDFISLIRHSNQHEYFLFRTGLYGYGLYDLTSKQEFFYIPDEPETFIWTDAHYNPITNMLAVGGCFWACPNGVTLLDFSDPMKETKWVDVISSLDGGYDKYDGLDFIRWHNNNLILKADELVEENDKISTKSVELEISEMQYREWFENV